MDAAAQAAGGELMLIDLGVARVLVTFSGPSNPWWLIFAIVIFTLPMPPKSRRRH
jgi:hypothetical protein